MALREHFGIEPGEVVSEERAQTIALQHVGYEEAKSLAAKFGELRHPSFAHLLRHDAEIAQGKPLTSDQLIATQQFTLLVRNLLTHALLATPTENVMVPVSQEVLQEA